MVWSILCILLAFDLLIGIDSNANCTQKWDKNCHCSSNLWIVCRHLSRIPDSIPNSTVFLSFEESYFGTLLGPKQTFELQNLESLRSLYFKNNGFERIEDNTFLILPKLMTLDISYNNIKKFQSWAFFGLFNLVYLHASSNQLVNISSSTFASTPLLRYLDLRNNNITTVAEEFAPLKKLSTLLLANNKIRLITPDAFAGLTNLWHLSLFGNKLTHSHPEWFVEILQNNGYIEVDHGFNISSIQENPSICCFSTVSYKNYLKLFNETLKRYNELNHPCFNQRQFSERITTSNLNKKTGILCMNMTYKIASSKLIQERMEEESLSKNPHKEVQDPYNKNRNSTNLNFLSKLTNGEIYLLFLLLLLIGGAVAASVCMLFKVKRTNEIDDFFPNFSEKADGNDSTLSTRPFRHNVPTYGIIDPELRRECPLRSLGQTEINEEDSSAEPSMSGVIPLPLETLNGAKYSVYSPELELSEEILWTGVEKRKGSSKSSKSSKKK